MDDVVVRPITKARFTDVETLFQTDSIMRGCWDIWPRYRTKAERAALVGRGTSRDALRRLAARSRAPGLLAYIDGAPVGFISLGPRHEMRRTDTSRTSPRVDDVPVWVVPCFFVHRDHRGRGVTVALLKAAVEYAAKRGAPAVEGYPRAPGTRVHPSAAFFGSVGQFRRAGFRKMAGPQRGLPKGWVPRYTMRVTIGRAR